MASYISHADLGGANGFGAVLNEPEGEYFHHDWERRVLALALATGANRQWNIDQSRRARETLPNYTELSYYEIWLAALERLLVERDMVTDDELRAGEMLEPPAEVAGPLRADGVAAALAAGSPTEREPTSVAQFSVGDRVRTRSEAVDGHTRLPGYAAGRIGVVDAVHGAHVFADSNALGAGPDARWLYTVSFAAADLWPDGKRHDRVSIDAWEPYLSPAEAIS